jgi:hypothetical protein
MEVVCRILRIIYHVLERGVRARSYLSANQSPINMMIGSGSLLVVTWGCLCVVSNGSRPRGCKERDVSLGYIYWR